MKGPRTVTAKHGSIDRVSVRWRARIEKRIRSTWFGFGKPVTEYRFVLERNATLTFDSAWEDSAWGEWTTESLAKAIANSRLDAIEAPVEGEYI